MVDPLGLKGKKVDLRYFKERARGLGHGFNDLISFFGKITPSHPISNLVELYTNRDLDSDGDSGWGTDKSPDDSFGKHGKENTRRRENKEHL